MVPAKLKLSNFTSYGDNDLELDFTNFHLAAISGPNGAGKSSLLDAITWCLWGSSRAGDSSDDLVRLGQNEMSVEFSFLLDNNTYTVKRKRIKKSGGNTALEFWSGSHNLTEGTIKATQQKIIDTLHLTFETFSSSSFLRQGHADEFTTKGPTDRKRILADILGLDHYDKLEEKAKEKAKDLQTKIQMSDYQIIEIEAELSQKEEREESLNVIKSEGEEVKKELEETKDLIQTIESEKQAVLNTINLLEQENKRYSQLRLELVELKNQIELKKLSQKEYEEILSQKAEIERDYQRLQKLNESRKGLEEKRSELIKVKDELVSIQKILQERESKRKDEITKLEVEIEKNQTQINQLNLQIEKLKNQKELCPTCNQIIGLEKSKQLLLENQKQIKELNLLIKPIEEKIKKYQSVVFEQTSIALEKEILVKKIEGDTKDYSKIILEINNLSQVESLYLKLQQAEVGLKTQQESLGELEKIYKSKEEEIKKSQENENLLIENNTKLEDINLRLNTKKGLEKELSGRLLDLRAKFGEASSLVERSKQYEDLLKTKQIQRQESIKEKEIYEELALAFGKRGIQAMIIENAIPEVEDETNRLLERLTDGRMKVRFETQKETKTKVQTAEGKIHAIVETLEIIISDEMGERAYELYSGGETFRVNFAIRLAISKLLAHRAGAKLQFLVIDEGFGTQDAAGRAKLIEVIDTIKNDFEKIVIITHIEELKEEFPVRIEVSKGAGGSTFEVVGV